MAESVKSKETAKKKVTRKLNPEETMVRGPESGVDSDTILAGRTLKPVSSPNEILAHGYNRLALEVDPFDNERNFERVRPEVCGVMEDPEPEIRAYNQYLPAPKYGAKRKVFDQDSEDYGHEAVSESDHQDD